MVIKKQRYYTKYIPGYTLDMKMGHIKFGFVETF